MREFVKKMAKNDIVVRTVKTFGQAVIGTLVAVDVTNITDMGYVRTLILSAVIAGVCAAWNIIRDAVDKWLKGLK